MISPVRGCSMDEVESERADRLREDASGGVPFPPCLSCRFSAYITCTQITAISNDFLGGPILITTCSFLMTHLKLQAASHCKI